MNNIEIIANEALAAGIYTENQIIDIIEEKGCLPLHTFSKWRDDYGMRVKAGEHARIVTRLWKRKKKKEKEGENGKDEFYLKKAFLFSEDQVEPIGEESKICKKKML